jgi:hypothetical protein
LPAYTGVVAARMRSEAEGSGNGGGGFTGNDPEFREVEPTQAALLVDPILGGLIEFG